MDEVVVRSLAKWPNVPAVYGWLSLDRRGNWLIKGEKIGNGALRDFIARNYQPDEAGRWFFQNGPQRVYVRLAYVPLVVRYEGSGQALLDHCGRPFDRAEAYLDDKGSVLMQGGGTIALLDDRDLLRFAERASAASLRTLESSQLAARFGFIADPSP